MQVKAECRDVRGVMDFLAQVKPFSEFRAGALVSAVKDQLLRQHHVCAMRGATLIGYCGWILFTEEMGNGGCTTKRLSSRSPMNAPMPER